MDVNASPVINQMLAKQQDERHQAMLSQMRQAIGSSESAKEATGDYPQFSGTTLNPISTQVSTATVINPAAMAAPTATPRTALNNLANNNDFTVATISKEAARIENNHRSI